MNWPEEFVQAGLRTLDQAHRAGEKLMEHCLTCGRCEHLGGEDLDVRMCAEAKGLHAAYKALYEESKPYMDLVRQGGSTGGRA
jgi:hypothetical protein